MRLRVGWLVGVALVVGGTGTAWGGLPETFARGNEAFWSGDYEGAISAYEEVLELGVWDADVLYNLGTAYGRAGQYGRAIVNLERALAVNPGDEEAAENLARLRQELARGRAAAGQDADLEPPRSVWLKFLRRISLGQAAIPFLVCYVAFFVLLLVRRVIHGEVVRLVGVVAGFLVGLCLLVERGVLASKLFYDWEVREAVAVAPGGAVVREGPGQRFDESFVAREGDRLRVLEAEGEWLLVRQRGGARAGA